MTGPDLPPPRLARVGRGSHRQAALDACLDGLYRALLPEAADHVERALRERLRADYLRTEDDARRVRRYAEDHADGVRATLGAVASDPHASRLLGPDALLVLERLNADPHGLRDNWPEDSPIEPLLALASANARPYER